MVFMVDCVGIGRQPGIKPAKKWSNMRPLFRLIAFKPLHEAGLAERNPNAPTEGIRFSDNWNFEISTNKEELLIDYAVVTSKIAPLFSFVFWDIEIA